MRKTNGVMTVKQAEKRFAGKWLALEVVARDKNGFPHKVRLIDEADTQPGIFERTRSLKDVYIIFAGPLVPPGWGFVLSPHVIGQ
ncbi:MAG: hypothetical protein FJ290_06440 [Planctomycetes bacterium]|nr:hypothetical protein [Planctomycetota bacterium]